MNSFATSIAEASRNDFERFEYAYEFRSVLRDLWGPEPELVVVRNTSHVDVEDVYRPMFSRAGPSPLDWTIAFTPSFRKAVAGVDKKLQGRVLEALAALSEQPLTLRGDTVKPLEGEMKGMWRYRVGDYRLVYEAREKERVVVLLEFDARGSVY